MKQAAGDKDSSSEGNHNQSSDQRNKFEGKFHDDKIWDQDKKRLITDEPAEIIAQLSQLIRHGRSWKSNSGDYLEVKVKNYYRAGMFNDVIRCVQLITIRARDDWSLSSPMKNRDNLLVTCDGDQNFYLYRKYQFTYGHFLTIYGHKRLIYWNKHGTCYQKVHGITGVYKKELSAEKCKAKIQRCHSWEGTARLGVWHIGHRST